MKLVKRILSVTVALGLITSAYGTELGVDAVPVYSIEAEVLTAMAFLDGDDLPVMSAILIEETTGQVLYEKDADMLLPPASVTKIMTLLLVMEGLESGEIFLDDMVTCSENAASFGGSQIWLKPGEEMSVDDLLKATAVASANDATVCLAEYVAGSMESFIEKMNQRAGELGMDNTTFKCVEGLDTEGHLTTARDIAIMSSQLMKYPLITQYSTIWMDSLRDGATQLVNTNRMVRFYDGATGLKTGTTSGAGSCLSTTAQRDGLKLVAVVMGAETSDDRFASGRALLDFGFGNYTMAQLPEVVFPESIPVTKGLLEAVPLYAVSPSGVLIEKEQESMLTASVVFEENLPAPVLKDQQVGLVTIMAGEDILVEYEILACEDVDELTFKKAWGLLWREFFKGEIQTA